MAVICLISNHILYEIVAVTLDKKHIVPPYDLMRY